MENEGFGIVTKYLKPLNNFLVIELKFEEYIHAGIFLYRKYFPCYMVSYHSKCSTCLKYYCLKSISIDQNYFNCMETEECCFKHHSGHLLLLILFMFISDYRKTDKFLIVINI